MTRRKSPTYTPNNAATGTDRGPRPVLELDEHNTPMRERAHRRLDELIDYARGSDRFYGSVSVEVQFEAGKITTVRRGIHGTDKNHT